MQTKDFILIAISATALGLSVFSLVITLIQKSKETKRAIKKTLSDTLESISKIAVESSKLKAQKDIDYDSESIIQLRRSYNSQRRVLISHADFLINQYDKISTESDCNVLAGAYSTIGDQEKAEHYWRKTIEKSISPPIKHMNLRGFGIYYFKNGRYDLGRYYFSEALSLKLPDNDDYKMLLIDTYLMLVDLENECSDSSNNEQYLISTMEILPTIKNAKSQDEMRQRIKSKLPVK